MRVLIIGGTKFLGYHLTKALLREGIQVTLFNRGITPDDFGNKVERVTGDRKNYKYFHETFRDAQFDAVVDLIGYDLEDIEVAEKTFRDRIGQYIFISSGQVYLITENDHFPATEEDYFNKLIPCPPGEEADYNYGLKKRQIEDFLEQVHRSRKFPSVRFRCPIIHGSHDYTLRLYSYLLRISDGNPVIFPEAGDKIIRHIYVQDVVNTIFSVLQVESTRGKVFNLAQEDVLTLTELLNLCAQIMNSSVEILEIPEKNLLEYNIPLDISPFSGRWVSYLDPTFAREEIGFQSTPLSEWLPNVISYFMEDYAGDEPGNYRFRPREIQLVNKWKQKLP